MARTAPRQDFGYKADQNMVGTVNFNSAFPVIIGGLPANAIVIAGEVVVTTAFNATTTNTMDIGYSDATSVDADAYASALTLPAAGARVALDEILTATAAPLSRPTNVTATYAQTGTAATAGSAKVIVRFVVP